MILHPVSPIVLSTASGSGCSLGLSASTVEASSAKSSVDSVVEDQLVAMLRQESCYRVEVIPCTAGDEVTSSSSRLPYEEWRRKICEWCYKVRQLYGVVSLMTIVVSRFHRSFSSATLLLLFAQ